MEGQIRSVFLAWLLTRAREGWRSFGEDVCPACFSFLESASNKLGVELLVAVIFACVCLARVGTNIVTRGWCAWLEWMCFGAVVICAAFAAFILSI